MRFALIVGGWALVLSMARVSSGQDASSLSKRMGSQFQEDREAAVAGFAKLDASAKKSALPELVKMVKGKDWFAQESAAKAIEGMGADAASAADELAGVAKAGLADKDLAVAGAALNALGSMGPAGKKAVGGLADQIKQALNYRTAKDYWKDPAGLYPVLLEGNPCPDVNRDAWADGEGIFPLLTSPRRKLTASAQAMLVPVLTGLLSDQAENVRHNAAFSLWLVRLDAKSAPLAADAAPALIKLVSSADKQVAQGAARVLGEMGAKEAIPALEGGLKDKDAGLARASADALGVMGAAAKPAIPALAEALKYGDQYVVYGAAGALLTLVPDVIDQDTVITMIGRAAADKSAPLAARKTAIDCLVKLGPDAKVASASMLEVMDGVDKDLAPRASAVIGQSGVDAKSMPALLAMLKGADKNKAKIAADTLSRVGADAKPALPALVELLKSDDAGVRASAANTLRRMGPAAKEATPQLIEALGGSDKGVVGTIARTLGAFGADAKFAVAPLMKLLSNPDKDLAGTAAGALGNIGADAKDALPALDTAAEDPEKKLSDQAKGAASQIRKKLGVAAAPAK